MMVMRMIPSESKMRVCIVVDNLNQSAGWGRLASKLSEGLRTEGYDVSFIVSSGDPSDDVEVIPMRGMSIYKPWKYLISLYNLRQSARKHEVVICFDANPYGIFTSIALLGTQVHYWLYCIGSYSLLTKSRFRNYLIRFAYYRANKKLIVSNFVLDQVRKSGISVKDFSFLSVGVDDGFFYKTDKRTNLIDGKYILSVGGIKYRKGFHLSIEAFGRISKIYPDIKYVIVGRIDDNDYYQALLRTISDSDLVGKVIFLHSVGDEDLRSLYSFAEFFLLTPITNDEAFEGFGMVYLEASMCGIPCVGSTNSGAVEAIIHKETGLLADPNTEDVSNAMMFLLDNEQKRNLYGEKALIWSKSFSWSNVYQKLNSFLIN